MIEQISEVLGGVSNTVVYALLVVAAVQVGVQIWALVDLAGRERVAGGRKWLWVVGIVLLSNLALGAILYFLVGRPKDDAVTEADLPQVAPGSRATRAVDALYGSPDAGERQ